MIAKSNNPLSPDVTIRFDNAEIDYTSITSMSLLLSEGKHDVCTLVMRGIHPKAITDYIDVPVRVSISNGAYRRQEFCGYVMYVEPTSDTRAGLVNQSPFQTAKIVCFGASMVMRGARTRVWENSSIGILSKDLANKYNFSLDVPADPFAFPRLVQNQESDWEFLNRVATEYGYRVSVHGTHMHIWDQAKALGRKSSYMVLTTMRKQMDAYPGMILRFEGSFGYVTPDGYSTSYRTIAQDNNGKTIEVTSSDLPTTSIGGRPSDTKFEYDIMATNHSVEEAKRYLAAKSKGAFPFNAHVDITAGAGIVPGGIVKIDEYNSNFDGFWYVKSVTHDVGGTDYLTRLHIARGFNVDNDVQIPVVTPVSEVPAPTLVKGLWKSESKRIISYA